MCCFVEKNESIAVKIVFGIYDYMEIALDKRIFCIFNICIRSIFPIILCRSFWKFCKLIEQS